MRCDMTNDKANEQVNEQVNCKATDKPSGMPNQTTQHTASHVQICLHEYVSTVGVSSIAKEHSQGFGCHVGGVLHRGYQAGVGESRRHSRALSDAEKEELREELFALRRKLRQLELERDLLAKAMTWFAYNRGKTSMQSEAD